MEAAKKIEQADDLLNSGYYIRDVLALVFPLTFGKHQVVRDAETC
jgi:hypothetical protein